MPTPLIALGAVTLAGAIGINLFRFFPAVQNVPPVPFSDDAITIIKGATVVAHIRRSDVVTPEHILIAVLDESLSCSGAQLVQRGIDVTALLEHLQGKHADLASKGDRSMPRSMLMFTARAKNVLVEAARAAFADKCDEAGPMHLLAGILQVKHTHASRVLRRASVTLDVVRTMRKDALVP